jgi:hypothetical protein
LLLSIYSFLILTGYSCIKPVREALSLQLPGGAEDKVYIAAATTVTILLALPAYAKAAVGLPRNQLIVSVTGFFAANLAIFYLLGSAFGTSALLGLSFYLWIAVFNMMIVAQFWAFANDIYSAFPIQEIPSVLEGTVKKIDGATKTVVVTTAEGVDHAMRFSEHTVVHSPGVTFKGTKAVTQSFREGSEVAVHYTAKGADETAVEIDNIGKDGLKVMEGTLAKVDRGARTIAVTTADGVAVMFLFTGVAVRDTAEGIGKGTEKAAKLPVAW